MNKLLKKLTVTAAATAVMAMGVTAFAANGDVIQHDASLYKANTYGTASQEESMGNAAVDGAEVTENANGTYTVKVKLVEDFKAYGIKSNMKSVVVNGKTTDMLDENGNGKYDAFQFEQSMNFPQKLTTTFTIQTAIMPVNATGDLVIF